MPSRRPVTSDERPFALEDLFFSATDRKGFIRSANRVFAAVAGYGPDEYTGAPHQLVRHPDMPRVVFRLLWDALERGEPICAYVKNRAKDGAHYWVLAIAFPTGDEHVSVRLKPTSALFAVVRDLYAELRELEERVEPERGRTAAMDASADLLHQRLAALGFESYEDFMWRAMTVEVSARRAVLGDDRRSTADTVHAHDARLADALATCWSASGRLGRLAGQLDEYDELAVHLRGATRVFDELADDVGLFALNAGLTAGRAGGRIAVLQTIADLMRRGSRDVEADVAALRDVLRETVRHVRRLAFAVAAATIGLEMTCSFLGDQHGGAEVGPHVGSDVDPDGHDADGRLPTADDGDESVGWAEHPDRVAKNTVGLLGSVERDLTSVAELLRGLPSALERLQVPLRRLAVHLGGLRILRLRAEVDAAGEASADEFTLIIEQVESHLADGTARADELRTLVTRARDHALATDWRPVASDRDAVIRVRGGLAVAVTV